MNKYVIDLHLFSQKVCMALIDKKMVDKNGKPDPIKLHNILYPNDLITENDIEKCGRSNFTEKTRKERNWINGVNYPKTMNDVLLLCNALDCDLDYFFTDMPCKTHDMQFIHDETGLSTEAVERLIKWNEKTKLPRSDFYHNSILFISDLLECCGIQAAALAQNVSDYLFCRRISETENLTSEITKDIHNKYEVKRVRASYKFFDCLEYI